MIRDTDSAIIIPKNYVGNRRQSSLNESAKHVNMSFPRNNIVE